MRERRSGRDVRRASRAREFDAFAAGAAGRPPHDATLLTAGTRARHPYAAASSPRRAPGSCSSTPRTRRSKPGEDGPTLEGDGTRTGAEEAVMTRKVADCRRTPSVMNCTLTITGEEEEVVRAAAEHAVSVHGHEDTPELRAMVRAELEDEKVPA